MIERYIQGTAGLTKTVGEIKSEYTKANRIYLYIKGQESNGIIQRLLQESADFSESDFQGFRDVYQKILSTASADAIQNSEGKASEYFRLT